MLTSSVAFYFIFGTTYLKLHFASLCHAKPSQTVPLLCCVLNFCWYMSSRASCCIFFRLHFIALHSSHLLDFISFRSCCCCFCYSSVVSYVLLFVHPCKLLTDPLLSLYSECVDKMNRDDSHIRSRARTRALAHVCCGCIIVCLYMLFFLTSHILISSVFRAFAITLASLNFIAVFSSFFFCCRCCLSSIHPLPLPLPLLFNLFTLFLWLFSFYSPRTWENFLFSRKHFPSQNWCFIKRRNNTLTAFFLLRKLLLLRSKHGEKKYGVGVVPVRCCTMLLEISNAWYVVCVCVCSALTIHMDAKWVFSFNNGMDQTKAYSQHSFNVSYIFVRGISQHTP